MVQIFKKLLKALTKSLEALAVVNKKHEITPFKTTNMVPAATKKNLSPPLSYAQK